MSRADGFRLLLLLALGSLMVIASPVSGAATTTDVDMGISAVAAATPAEDGGWWVLERSLRDDGGVLFRYSEDWRRMGDVRQLRLGNGSDRQRSFSPTDLAPARGGGWWVLDDYGRAHRFSADFQYTGESHRLLRPRSNPWSESGPVYNATSASGLLETRSGGWWLAASGHFWRANASWGPAEDAVVTILDGASGKPVAVADGAGPSIWVLRGSLGKSVDRLRLSADGASVRDVDRAEEGFLPLPKRAVAQVTYTLDAPDTPVDVVRSGEHWWIVDADGEVHQHDRYWRYTGVTRSVGSSGAGTSYPADVVSPAIILVPLIEGLVFVAPAAVIVAGLAWRRAGADMRLRLAGGAGALLFVYGVVASPQFVRPIAFLNVYLPLVVAGLAVALPAGHVWHVRSRREWARAKPLVVAYAPVILSALSMLGPALRPLIAPY